MTGMALKLDTLPFFPSPQESETIYSLVCRFRERSMLPVGAISNILIKRQSIDPFLSVFSNQFLLMSSVVPQHHPWRDPRLLIRKHSLLPYFMYFNSLDYRLGWEDMLLSSNSQYQQSTLGKLKALAKATSRHPRFCKTCAKEDYVNLGFSYFRREHQLPGVAVCWKHREILAHGCRVCGEYPLKRRGVLYMPGRCCCSTGVDALPAYSETPGNMDLLCWLAQESNYVLSSRLPHGLDFYAGLRACVRKRGFHTGSPEFSRQLAGTIEDHFGKEFLKWLGVPIWKSGKAAEWIKRFLVRKLRQNARKPTLHYLLIIGALIGSVESFEKEALSLIQNNPEENLFPVRPRSSVKVQNLVERHKVRLMEYRTLQHMPIDLKIINLLDESYNYLKTCDPEWIYENYPEKPPWREVKKTMRINNDSEKARDMKAVIEVLLLSESMPKQIVKTELLKATGLIGSFHRNPQRYPYVQKTLLDHVESKEDFLKRKIRWAISKMVQSNQQVSMENIRDVSKLPFKTLMEHHQYILEVADISDSKIKNGNLSYPKVNQQLGLF